MKDYTITIDILEAVYDFYPGLSTEEATQIADCIMNKWDYTGEYDKISDDITWYAKSLDINLEGKDGIEIPFEEEESKEKVLVLNPPPSRLFP
tara:strand:- start:1665 stop:1943 length:279 start_codon:yes stop_codon:yes gene_type:complete